ncbi:MAG TPA: hypothetical protein VGM14_08265 [Streptosporangiaceae bacterium]
MLDDLAAGRRRNAARAVSCDPGAYLALFRPGKLPWSLRSPRRSSVHW